MKPKQKLFRLISTGYLLAVLLFGYLPVAQADIINGPINTNQPASTTLPKYDKGVDNSIRDFLCTPDASNVGGALYDCIGRLYRFGVAFGAIALVFFVVWAGYMYMVSGETGKAKAKGYLINSLVGMGMILGSYVLLNFINPDLVKIKPIQPPIFSASLPSCEAVGFEVDCIISSGPNAGQVYHTGTPGNANEQQYAALINKYAQMRNIEYCALSALMQKESSYRYLIVSNGPPGEVNPSSGPPTYNITDFDSKYHAIGLTQITIYERRRGLTSGWTNGIPARSGPEFGSSKVYYVKDLIDPDTNVSAGSYFWANLIRRNNGNLYEAYRDYQGPSSAPATLQALVDMYNACKRRGT